jgi:hypothetical protein
MLSIMVDPNPAKSATVKLARTAKGKRPRYFADPATDKLLNMVVNLMAELSVTRDRLDTVERLLESHSLVPTAEIETYRPAPAVESIRDQKRAKMIQRVLRPVERELAETAPPDQI